MARYEKLVLALVGLVLLSHVGGLLRDIYLSQTYGTHVPPQVYMEWKNLSVLIAGLANLGTAIWLYIDAKRDGQSKVVWSVFGLTFGLLAVIAYHLLRASSNRTEAVT